MADTTSSTCAEATVADIIVKSALVGAIGYIVWRWATEEGVVGKDIGSRAARYASGRMKGFFFKG